MSDLFLSQTVIWLLILSVNPALHPIFATKLLNHAFFFYFSECGVGHDPVGM